MHGVILFLAGLLVGAMNAIAGGGSLVGFPIMLGIGVPALTANATLSLVVLPGNLAAIFGYRRLLKKVSWHYLLLLIPAAIGATIGALILRHTSSSDFEKIIPGLIFFAVALFTFQPFLYKELHQHIHGPARYRQKIRPLVVVAIALIPLAIYGGYFGAGFGFIMLAFLGFTGLRSHIHRMNALKNVIASCIAFVSVICLSSSHLINWHYGVIMGAGNLIGGYVGSIQAQKVSSQALRIIVIIIGVSTAAYLGLRHY